MALVKNDQAELVSQTLHVHVGRVICGHGQRPDVVVAPAHQPDLGAKAHCQLVIPLVHQVDRGRDHQRRSAGLLDRQVRQVRLAGSGRQHDHPAATLLPPGLQTLHLVGKRLLGDLKFPGHRIIGPRLVGVGDSLLTDVLDQRAIPDRLGAEDLCAVVVLDPGQARLIALGETLDDQRAGVEGQPQGGIRDVSRRDTGGHELGVPGCRGSGSTTIDCVTKLRPSSVPQFTGFREVGP